MKMMFIFLLSSAMLFQASQQAAVPPEAAAVLVEQGMKQYNEMVKHLQGGIKSLFIVEELTKIATYIAKLNVQMEKKQKEAIEGLLEVHEDAQKALDSARVVVDKLKDLCDTLIFILEEKNPSDENIKDAIQTFVEEGKLMEGHVTKAIERLIASGVKSTKVEAVMITLEQWVDGKKSETIATMEASKAAAREDIYTKSAGCVAALWSAPIVCTITYGVTVGITEGKTVKEIEASYEDAIQKIGKMRKEIKSIGTKTKDLVKKVGRNKDKMMEIRSKLDQTNRAGRMTVRRFREKYLNRFKTALNDLYKKCVAYLKQKN